MFLLGGKTGEYLKANVLEWAGSQNATADFTVKSDGTTLSFHNSKLMNQVTELSFSISYDPELWNPSEVKTSLAWWDITEISNQAGFSTYLINFSSATDILEDSPIASTVFNKILEDTVHLNVMNVNFKDLDGETYLLSSSWTMF